MKTKFNLDREYLDKEHIDAKQDFTKVVKGYRASHFPVWKRPWFYGPTGAAAFALILSMTIFNDDNAYDNNNTPTASVSELTNLEDTPCIHPINEKKDLAFGVYKVIGGEEAEIKLASGTIIQIPKESFEDLKGKIISLKVREFKTKEEAFIAGIPMDYKNHAFESAGMIELRSDLNGESVKINPEAPISVNLATYKSGEDFKFWSLNEDGKAWEHKISKSLVVKLDDRQIEKEIDQTLIQIADVNEKIDIKDTECQKVAKQKIEKEHLLPSANARKLKIDFDSKDFPELKGYSEMEFEYLNYSDKLSQDLKKEQWTDVDLYKSNNYVAVFSNSRTSKNVDVKPVLIGQTLIELEKQIAEAKVLKQSKLNELEVEKIRLEKQKKVLLYKHEKLVSDLKLALNSAPKAATEGELVKQRRAATTAVRMSSVEFTTTSWGVFNSDKPIPYPPVCPAPFILESKSGQVIRPSTAYVFDNKKDLRYTFGVSSAHSLKELGWNRDDHSLLVIDDQGKMYLCPEIQKGVQGSRIKFDLIDSKNLDADKLKDLLVGKVSII
jgi:hypothetical protein